MRTRTLFVISTTMLVAGVMPLQAQRVVGTLYEAGSPSRVLPGAEVILLDDAWVEVDRTLTDGSGRFLLHAPSAGEYWLEGQWLGSEPFRQGPMTLDGSGTTEVAFTLPEVVVQLEGLEVEVEKRARALTRTGFYERLRVGGGVHVTPLELGRRRSNEVQELLRTVPGVLLPNARTPGQSYILFRDAIRAHARTELDGNKVCAPRILLDGAVVQMGGMTPVEDLLDLDQVVTADQVAGIEIYRSPAEMPAQYGGAHSMCGVILVWTVS